MASRHSAPMFLAKQRRPQLISRNLVAEGLVTETLSPPGLTRLRRSWSLQIAARPGLGGLVVRELDRLLGERPR